jgi:glucose/arabinose dehydrogenase
MSLDGEKKVMFSKGHRNPQGLLSTGKVILSTEHGPYGGDEINKIEYGKNYGYPKSSYGDSYNFEKILNSRSEYNFKKSHADYLFEEPIFSFVPSIGISEIIKVPNNFSKYWQNNFLVSSLNGRTLYRVEFNETYSKIKYLEPIRLGERIRDIKYIPKLNAFVLALEDTGSISFMRVKN